MHHIAIGKKNSSCAGRLICRPFKILGQLADLSSPVSHSFIHWTEKAAIMWASVRNLENQAIAFGGWAEKWLLVAHKI